MEFKWETSIWLLRNLYGLLLFVSSVLVPEGKPLSLFGVGFTFCILGATANYPKQQLGAITAANEQVTLHVSGALRPLYILLAPPSNEFEELLKNPILLLLNFLGLTTPPSPSPMGRGDRSKNVGVVDAMRLSLRLEAQMKTSISDSFGGAVNDIDPRSFLMWLNAEAPSDASDLKSVLGSGTPVVDDSPARSWVRRQSFVEFEIFKGRWERSMKDDECWIDPYPQPAKTSHGCMKLHMKLAGYGVLQMKDALLRSQKHGEYLIDAPESIGDGFSFSGAHPVLGGGGKAKDPIFGLTMGSGSQASVDVFRWFCVEEGTSTNPLVLLIHGFLSQHSLLIFMVKHAIEHDDLSRPSQTQAVLKFKVPP
ncbi:hypothetical protein ACLOJK_001757 [Asimina triloba]